MLKLDANIYASNNQMQQRDALYALDHHLKFVKWHKSPSIMDVGSGECTVLLNLLMPKLPKDFKKVVAVDINEEMLNIAKNKPQRNLKVEFFRMDIATPSLPIEFLENFDHIFSFYCLHWVIEQRRVYTNLFAMLKPGSDMLLTLVAKDVISNIHEEILKINKWTPFMTDIKQYTIVYQHSSNPVREIEDHLKIAGFVDYAVKLEDRVHIFKDVVEFWNFSCGINPFIKKIPTEELHLYRRDYLNAFRQNTTIVCKKDGKIHLPYEMLIVYAVKPETIP